MVVWRVGFIGAVIGRGMLTIGRFGFGRREKFNSRRFFTWFAWFFVINYLICLAILYLSEPALTGPFGGWQWLLWPLIISSIANLFAFARPALSVLEEASATSQGRSRSSTPTQLPSNASRGAIAAGIFGLAVAAAIRFSVSGFIFFFTTRFSSNTKTPPSIPPVLILAS